MSFSEFTATLTLNCNLKLCLNCNKGMISIRKHISVCQTVWFESAAYSQPQTCLCLHLMMYKSCFQIVHGTRAWALPASVSVRHLKYCRLTIKLPKLISEYIIWWLLMNIEADWNGCCTVVSALPDKGAEYWPVEVLPVLHKRNEIQSSIIQVSILICHDFS